MRASVSLSALVASLCFIALPAHSEDASSRMKAELAKARLEAAGLVAPPQDDLQKPSAVNDDEMMIAKDKADATRVPLAAISSPKDPLLEKAEKETEITMPAPVAIKPVATKAPTTLVPVPATAPDITAPPKTSAPVAYADKSLPPAPIAMPAPAIVAPPVVSTITTPAPQINRTALTTATIIKVPQPVIEAPKPQPMPEAQAAARFAQRQPPAANRIGAWKVRQVKSEKPFCLMEARFDNSLGLMIGQRADGFATLGVNYGLDMLQKQRSYQIAVTLDNGFDEDFNGYAENAQTVIAQMGRKQSFFDALGRSQKLAVMMPGVTSVFNLNGLSDAQAAFGECLTSIGAAPQPAPIPQNDSPMLVSKVENPVVTTETIPPQQVAPIAPPVAAPVMTPPAPVAMPTPAPIAQMPAPIVAAPVAPPVVAAPVVKETPAPMPEPKAPVAPGNIQHLLFDDGRVSAVPSPAMEKAPSIPVAPVATMPAPKVAPAMPMPITAPMPKATPAPATPSRNTLSWSDAARDLLFKAGIGTNHFDVRGDRVLWSDQGNLFNGKILHLPQGDVIDAANNALTMAENECGGAFDSQMGIPENYGDVTAQPMESKCTKGGKVTLATWLVVQQDDAPIAIAMEGPTTTGKLGFDMREKLIHALKH